MRKKRYFYISIHRLLITTLSVILFLYHAYEYRRDLDDEWEYLMLITFYENQYNSTLLKTSPLDEYHTNRNYSARINDIKSNSIRGKLGGAIITLQNLIPHKSLTQATLAIPNTRTSNSK